MMEFKPETDKAIDAGRIHYLVFFDFMFFPFRVHSGNDFIEWDGYEWTGIGEVLTRNFHWVSTQFNGGDFRRGCISASLPLDKEAREVVAEGYYRNREMTLYMCPYDECGNIIEGIGYSGGYEIIKFTQESNIITFEAIDTTFDNVAEIDARHKETVETIREQFLESAMSISTWIGFISITSGDIVIGLVTNLIGFFIPSRIRSLKQRLKAKKRIYWFMTSPKIPGIRAYKKGYWIRADTLEEAKERLYSKIEKKIWQFPRGWIMLQVVVDEKFLELFDLDYVRQCDDYDRWKETDPARRWGKE